MTVIRGGSLSGRSRAEWGVRALLAVVVALVGYSSVVHALAYDLSGSAPQRAHALAPGDGRIAAAFAASLVTGDATAADRRWATTLARSALRTEPTAVAALSTIGLDAALRGDSGAARPVFAYSQTLSRRDLPTQLWAIEDAVGQGDVAAALNHYDIALRTSRNAPDLLFPVLASAVPQANIRQALARTLARKPPWGAAFIGYLASNGPDFQSVASLFTGLPRMNVAVPDDASTAVVNNLIAKDLMAGAWRYYAAIHPRADRRSSRDAHFDGSVTAASLLDWIPITNAGMNTSIQRGERGGIFDFAVPPGSGGPLLQQMQMLPPGTYRLTGHSIGIDQPLQGRPYWLLRCQSGGREVGRLDVPSSSESQGHFSGIFTVPASDCAVQMLTLIARPADVASGVSGQMDEVRLAPLATGNGKAVGPGAAPIAVIGRRARSGGTSSCRPGSLCRASLMDRRSLIAPSRSHAKPARLLRNS